MTDFCRELSIVAGEPLAGSAAHVRAWIVVEVREPWEAKHLPGSSLAPAIKERIEAWLEAIPASRLQFIRRPGDETGPLTVFVARSDREASWLLRFTLPSHDALLDLDLAQVVRDGAHPDATPVREPLYLVCCHGKRDRCCAKFGVALYHTVCGASPDRAWHTTHLGGHRFAATMVVLPHGICYGRLDASEGARVVSAHERGECYEPSRMRGRSAYEPPVQAAEIEARLRTGDRSLAGPHIAAVDTEGPETRVRFASAAGELTVRIRTETLDGERPTSCGDEPSAIEGLRVAR